MTKNKKEKPENVKVGFILKRKQAVMLKVLAKVLRVSQGEILGHLLDISKKDKSTLVKLRAEVEKNRKSEEELIKKIKEL